MVRNDPAGLAATVASVQEQDLVGVEHLIVDGASTDATRAVLDTATGGPGTRVISEPDRGIYDAMNKGWRRAGGFWVQYLNAGDTFRSRGEVSWVRGTLTARSAQWLRTRVRFVDQEGRQTRPLASPHIDAGFWWGWQATLHQGAFMSVDLLRELGGFDADLRIQADFDLMLRAVQVGCRPLVSDHVTVDVDASGVSTALWRVGYGEMHQSRSAGRPLPVRAVSAVDYLGHVGTVASKRAARRTLEQVLGPERFIRLRS